MIHTSTNLFMSSLESIVESAVDRVVMHYFDNLCGQLPEDGDSPVLATEYKEEGKDVERTIYVKAPTQARGKGLKNVVAKEKKSKTNAKPSAQAKDRYKKLERRMSAPARTPAPPAIKSVKAVKKTPPFSLRDPDEPRVYDFELPPPCHTHLALLGATVTTSPPPVPSTQPRSTPCPQPRPPPFDMPELSQSILPDDYDMI
jgi:hypothetical protein